MPEGCEPVSETRRDPVPDGAGGDGSPPPWRATLDRLAEVWRALHSGQQDPLEVRLEPVVAETLRAFGPPPEDFERQEAWLGGAADALRILAELAAAKAQRLAPLPQSESSQQGEATAPGVEEEAVSGEEGPDGSLEELALRAETYKRFREAARVLEEQAEAWSRHQPRQAPSALLETLQKMLGPWPGEAPQVSPDLLVEALARLLRRSRLADQARQAPAPAFDWAALLERVRRRARAPAPVDLAQMLAEEAADRSELIGLFLTVLELVRVGELWLKEQNGSIWIVSRS